jgi:D-psicose/D-tagatose/L-ribulose 3-epimerase
VKLAVSNIAWEPAEEGAVLALLRNLGIQGIEVAPTRLWPDWAGAAPGSAADWRRRFAAERFVLPSMQAILFGKPELQIFGSEPVRRATLDHLGRVAELAAALGARVLVFGAPRNRERGTLTPDEAFTRAVDFFREAGRICAAHDASLCIEPLPEAYGSNFATRWSQAADLVIAVDTPGFGLHLDTGCIHLAGDDPAGAVRACKGLIRHFHASEPHLVDLGRPLIDHRGVGEALREVEYEGWVSLEMRRPAHDALGRIGEAMAHLWVCYGDD